jgi:lysophospholipase L1-like esterase
MAKRFVSLPIIITLLAAGWGSAHAGGKSPTATACPPSKTKSQAKSKSRATCATPQKTAHPGKKTSPKTALHPKHKAQPSHIHTKPAPVRRRAIAVPAHTASDAEAPASLPAVPLEGDGGENLRLFFRRLRQLETAENGERVRIMQIGDSHTAGDYFSHALRTAFQQRFADGGPGWLRPGGLKNYRSAQVAYQQSPVWQIFDSRTDKQRQFSLGGFVAATDLADANLSYQLHTEPAAAPSFIELTWQGGPDAGRVAVLADGETVGLLQTGTPSYGWLNTRVDLKTMPHALALKTLDNKPVQLAGVTVEYNRQGVVLDSIGTNGAQLSILGRWDGTALRQQLAHRNPALIILGYGTNEAYDPHFAAEQLRQNLQQTAWMLRNSLPHAAVLLLAPPDSMRENDCGGAAQQKLAQVRQVQRQMARENHWLYWDWSALMGGRCGIARWEKQQLARTDHVHMTPRGYVLSAQALFDALMARYQQFVDAAQERSLHKV